MSSGVTCPSPGSCAFVSALSSGVTEPAPFLAWSSGRPKFGFRLASCSRFVSVCDDEKTPRKTTRTATKPATDTNSVLVRSRFCADRSLTRGLLCGDVFVPRFCPCRARWKASRKIAATPFDRCTCSGSDSVELTAFSTGSAGYVPSAPDSFSFSFSGRFSMRSFLSVEVETADAEADRRERRAVYRPTLRHLQKQHLVRLLVRWPVEHDHSISPLARADPPAAEPVVGNLILFGRDPPRLQLATQLNLRRHQFDAVLLWVQRAEQHHDFPALVNDFADARLHQFLARIRNSRLAIMQFW